MEGCQYPQQLVWLEFSAECKEKLDIIGARMCFVRESLYGTAYKEYCQDRKSRYRD